MIKKKPIFFKNTADGQLVFLGTEDITKIIRTNEVTQNVSKISALAPVREFLVAEQQRIADEGGIIMDGRDIGTVVLPHADLKIFLVASVDERAGDVIKKIYKKIFLLIWKNSKWKSLNVTVKTVPERFHL